MAESRVLDDFLSRVPKNQREKVRSFFSQQRFDRGQFVFFEGDPMRALFLIEEGVIEANAVHGDGKVFIFLFAFPGDILGEGILYGCDEYPFSAVVRKDLTVWKIARDDLLLLIENNPALKDYALHVVGRKLENSYIKARCIAGERVEKRVACILIKAIGEQGGANSFMDKCTERIDTPLTNRDISGLIGSTEETVSRVMSRLKKEGVIAVKDKQLVILDREKLLNYFDSM